MWNVPTRAEGAAQGSKKTSEQQQNQQNDPRNHMKYPKRGIHFVRFLVFSWIVVVLFRSPLESQAD